MFNRKRDVLKTVKGPASRWRYGVTVTGALALSASLWSAVVAQINNPGLQAGAPFVVGQCLQAGPGVGQATTTGAACAGGGVTPAAMTQANDTNVTLSLSGTPATALLQSVQIAAGWTGTLAAARLNANVVQAVTNDTNLTGSISAQNLTLGWTGTLAAARLNANVVQAVTNDTNITGSIVAQNMTLGWSGTLSAARGGFGANVGAAAGVPFFTAGVAAFKNPTSTGQVFCWDGSTVSFCTRFALGGASNGAFHDIAVPLSILIGSIPSDGASLLIDATVGSATKTADVAAAQFSPNFDSHITDDAAVTFAAPFVAAGGAVNHVYGHRVEDIGKGAGASVQSYVAFKADSLTGAVSNVAFGSDLNTTTPASTAPWGNGTVLPKAPYHINRNAVTTLAPPADTYLYITAQDGTNNTITQDVYQNGGFKIPGMAFRSANGTGLNPARTNNGDFIGLFGSYGCFSAAPPCAFTATASALITFVATENWVDATHNGTRIDFGATANANAPNATVATMWGSKCLNIGLGSSPNDCGAGGIQQSTTTVAALGTCNAANQGTQKFVSDANAATFHTTAAGGGTNKMGVRCDGTVWYLN